MVQYDMTCAYSSLQQALRDFVVNVTGIATMFDTRRSQEYDPEARVERFLNLDDVKRAMGAHENVGEHREGEISKEVGWP